MTLAELWVQAIHAAAVAAAAFGRLDVLQYLVTEHGASVSEARHCGICLLCEPFACHDAKSHKLVFDHKFSATASVAHAAAVSQHKHILDFIISRGGSVNMVDAVRARRRVWVDRLWSDFARGVQMKRTPLMFVCERGNKDIAVYLIEHCGADPAAGNKVRCRPCSELRVRIW